MTRTIRSDIELFNQYNDSDFEALPAFKLKTIYYANGTVDFIATRTKFKTMEKEAFSGEFTSYPKVKTDEEKEATRLENIERAARRARQSVHRLVRSMGADHMLTLHTRENITDVAEFDDLFTRFIRIVREQDLIGQSLHNRRNKRVWQYVAVREYQERGALHMHIACVGKQDLRLLRAAWYVALGGSITDTGSDVRGQIDVQTKEKRFSGATEIHKTFALVRYLTKYISKTFENDTELGQRRYKASREIAKPIVLKQYLPVYFSYGETDFTDAVKAVHNIACFQGVTDFEPWNKGLDIYILRGMVD